MAQDPAKCSQVTPGLVNRRGFIAQDVGQNHAVRDTWFVGRVKIANPSMHPGCVQESVEKAGRHAPSVHPNVMQPEPAAAEFCGIAPSRDGPSIQTPDGGADDDVRLKASGQRLPCARLVCSRTSRPQTAPALYTYPLLLE